MQLKTLLHFEHFRILDNIKEIHISLYSQRKFNELKCSKIVAFNERYVVTKNFVSLNKV